MYPPPLILLQKKDLPPSFSFVKKRIHMDIHFERRAYWFVLKFIGYPLSPRQSANGYITTLCYWLTLPSCVRVYMINICSLLIFILCKGKSRSLVCISTKQRISWHWTDNFYVNKLTKKQPNCKMNC